MNRSPGFILMTDGEFRASDGCNSGFGRWHQQAVAGTLQGDILFIFDESGELLGTMERR